MGQPPSVFETRKELFLEKPLPSSVESEKALLGAILLDNDAMAQIVDRVFPGDFYSPVNRSLFRAMLALFEASSNIDPILVLEELKKALPTRPVVGVAEIASLIHGVPHGTDVKSYAQIIKDKSILRRLIRSSHGIVELALAEESTVEAIVNEAEQRLYNLKGGQALTEFSAASDLVDSSIALSHTRSQEGTSIIGLRTGYFDLDYKLQGLQRGDSIVLAARPSVGKTTLAMNICQYAAFEENKSVAVFSLEMSKEQLSDKLVISEASVDGRSYTLGNLDSGEWEKIEEARERILGKNLHIDDYSSTSPALIRSKLRRLCKQVGQLDLVMLDYLQLMGSGNSSFRQVEVAELSRQLKLIAREFDVPVLLLSQLSRQSENRANHRPNLSDLRESGAIEQDADVVMFIYRDDLYNPDPQYHTNEAEIIIAKNRKGPIGVAKLLFDGPKSRFRNLSLEHGHSPEGDF